MSSKVQIFESFGFIIYSPKLFGRKLVVAWANDFFFFKKKYNV